MLFYDSKQPFLVPYLPLLEYLLEDIVAELVLCEVHTLRDECLKDGLFCVGLTALDYGLNCS